VRARLVPCGLSLVSVLALGACAGAPQRSLVQSAAPAPEQLILQVERPTPAHANLRSGSSVKRIEYVTDGARLVTGGYLLKAPLTEGADWAGPAGRVRITAVEREVSVAAGRFVGCLDTTETDLRGGSPRIISTTFCPDVGIVRFSVEADGRQERFELQSFGPRVDIDRLD
jgi:hypothetical protein